MDLEQQISLLIQDAPQYGVSSVAIEQAIAPVLRLFATQLQHLEYYLLQTLADDWILTTLTNRAQPTLEKKVIYAFPTLKDAGDFQVNKDPQIIASSVPVAHILFQVFTLEQVDSVVFVETPGNLTSGKEIRTEDLQKLMMRQIQQLRSKPSSGASNLPPNLA
ncbi:MAG: hypothetical protein SAJ37_10885 [Oscillatoria sp. PMC 1068.18]|nr:hypothetical protein [Oscillatoria sp. PMC 1076.18]MEC4989245.1 hypothetical protein [Oscillatoria sp. PMC 1068.18]